MKIYYRIEGATKGLGYDVCFYLKNRISAQNWRKKMLGTGKYTPGVFHVFEKPFFEKEKDQIMSFLARTKLMGLSARLVKYRADQISVIASDGKQALVKGRKKRRKK